LRLRRLWHVDGDKVAARDECVQIHQLDAKALRGSMVRVRVEGEYARTER